MILFCQLPVSIANPVTNIKIITTPIATTFLLILFFCGSSDFNSRVSLTGQTSTQFKQVEHSSDITVFTLSTFIKDGQALLQSPQSIQLDAFL